MEYGSYFKLPAEYYRKQKWAYPDTLRLRGSVIPAVISDVVVITAFSASIIFFEKSHFMKESLTVPNMIVPALSVVVGLILAFRTNTAYDRFWEGRKLWSGLDVQIRNFSRMIWVGMKELSHDGSHAAAAKPGKGFRLHGRQLFGRSAESLRRKQSLIGAENSFSIATVFGIGPVIPENSSSTSIPRDSPSRETVVDITEDDAAHFEYLHDKILVIRLLLAFAVAVKHHLRQEFSTDYPDIVGLLPEDYVPCAAKANRRLNVKTFKQHDKSLGDRDIPGMGDTWIIDVDNDDGEMSLPLEIAHGLSLWVLAQHRAGMIEATMIGNLLSSINAMTDVFTNMERIVFTPIPLAYSIHLRQVVYLYCLALPFTFIEALGWLTVPVMFLVSFTLFGMECIGREIENPFGKDANDLHMDEFCRDLKRELEYLVTLKNTIPPGQEA